MLTPVPAFLETASPLQFVKVRVLSLPCSVPASAAGLKHRIALLAYNPYVCHAG